MTKKIMAIEFYLGHPMESRKEVREWELSIEKKFPRIKLINPFYDTCNKYMKEVMEQIDNGIKLRDDVNADIVVEQDIQHLSKSQGMIAVLDKNITYGTPMEMVYAYKIFNLPVFAIVTNGEHTRPWIRKHSSQIFTKTEDFENFLIKNY